MASTALCTNTKAAGTRPRVLVVDDEVEVLGAISNTLIRELDCKIYSARSLAEAQELLEEKQIELLVTDVNLPDGDGTTLLPVLRRKHPNAHAIIITGSPTADGAIAALRHGAVDFVSKPYDNDDFSRRVHKAIKRQSIFARNERRLDKLRDAVKRLNDARRTVTKKVDLLCNDLISAYGELSRQLDMVRVQEGFKNFLGDGKDLEQMLCHTMDYVMRQMGYCNIAIWLAGEDEGDFQLGAYMKYTIPGEDDLTNALRAGIVKIADKEGFIRLNGDDAQHKLTEQELDYLADQDILAVNCTYLGETLAVMVIFRDASKGFVETDISTLKTISPLFALSLASVVRDAQEEKTSEEGPYADDDNEERRKADDWWKNGEPPPF